MPVGARQSRRQFRRVIITVDPPAPVAGWVPPRLVSQPPQPPPQNGRIKRSSPVFHPIFTAFTLRESRKISSPQLEPPNGYVSRTPVPLQDMIAIPIVQSRRTLSTQITTPDLTAMLGSVKRTLNPQRLYLRRLLTPPYCWTGQVFSPGAVAGQLHTPGASAGQTGCGD